MIIGIIVLLLIIGFVLSAILESGVPLSGATMVILILLIIYTSTASNNVETSVISEESYIVSEIQEEYYLIETDKGVYAFIYTDSEGRPVHQEVSYEDITEAQGLETPQVFITVTKSVIKDENVNFWFPTKLDNTEEAKYKVIVPRGTILYAS